MEGEKMSAEILKNRFSSFEELENYLQEYSSRHKVHLYINQSRKLEASAKRSKSVREAKAELVYYSLRYNCVHGGAYRRRRTVRGERSTKSRKLNCGFFLQFVLSKDGQFLILSRNNSSHNHPLDEESFRMHPKERRLPKAIQEKAGALLNMKVNKKMLRLQLMQETGKKILFKDLSNIAAKYKAGKNNMKTPPRIFCSQDAPTPSVSVSEHQENETRSHHEKFQKASEITTQLANVLSEASGVDYEDRIQLLQDILQMWKANKNVKICSGSCSSCPGLVPVNVDRTQDDTPISLQNTDPIPSHTHSSSLLPCQGDASGSVLDIPMTHTPSNTINLPSTSTDHTHSSSFQSDIPFDHDYINTSPSTTILDHEKDRFSNIDGHEENFDHAIPNAHSSKPLPSQAVLYIPVSVSVLVVSNAPSQQNIINLPSTSTVRRCADIKLPQPLNKSEHPRGFNDTVIGLSRKVSILKKKKT